LKDLIGTFMNTRVSLAFYFIGMIMKPILDRLVIAL